MIAVIATIEAAPGNRAALLAAAGNGLQGALLSPTEALALQHAERLVAPCAALGVRLGVLVGFVGRRR